MPVVSAADIAGLYEGFRSPLAIFDCGQKCSPYNELGVPFCCDTRHAVPTAYLVEWEHLKANTDLWHLWEPSQTSEASTLRSKTPPGQVLIECLGHKLCQRGFRSITCRAFPFFPYINQQSEFIGLSYYWDYEDRCWIISHLDAVTTQYRREFMQAYQSIFELYPQEFENFRHHSMVMRRIFGRRHRAITLLHHNGFNYKITPRNGRMRRVPAGTSPKYGPYRIAAKLPFPDEAAL